MKKKKLKDYVKDLTANQNDYMSSFRKNIDLYVSDKDITLSDIAEEADIPFSTLRTFLYGNASDCKLSTAVKLARAFGVSVDEIVGSETISEITRGNLVICRNLPENSLYLVRWFIQHQERIYNKYSKRCEKVISVMYPRYVEGHLNPTNEFNPLNIDNLSENVKAKVFLGIKIDCENYMPHYSPYDILLIANDRNPTFKEHVIILYYGKIFITTRSERIENGEKIIEYTGIRDKNFVVRENETDDVIGYVVDVYNETLKK